MILVCLTPLLGMTVPVIVMGVIGVNELLTRR
jgi:hypothetical protein